MIRKEYPLDELPPILQRVEKQKFKVFKSGNYDLNIVGVRTIKNRVHNQFDDWIHVAYPLQDRWIVESARFTTDPGRYWLTKKDYKACAVFYHPQQCRGAYKLGFHRSNKAHPCLRQIKSVHFWRDQNKDEHADYYGRVYSGLIGLNIHRSSTREDGSKFIDRWSAGCQVFQNPKDHERFIFLCEQQVIELGYKSFTYTLLPEEL